MSSREKLWDINIVVKEIQSVPQTYNMILGDLKDDGTCQFLLRRKMNKLCKSGIVFKMAIPGTRFGKIIYYTMPKDYHIVVEASRTGNNVYYFHDYDKINKFYIEVSKYFKLDDDSWMKKYNKRIFSGDVLKWI